jgi:predicted RNA binding protein YcfA (HicA-like mRNA interferase family)
MDRALCVLVLKSGTEYGTIDVMGRTAAEILEQARRSPANVRFADLRRLVEALGYRLRRQKGSHHVFTHATRPSLPMINLQSDGATAKPYQVRQVLRLLEENKLEVES